MDTFERRDKIQTRLGVEEGNQVLDLSTKQIDPSMGTKRCVRRNYSTGIYGKSKRPKRVKMGSVSSPGVECSQMLLVNTFSLPSSLQRFELRFA